ncbi:MAG: hypothetical protein OHK006_02400 [Thermodesulfovibrionales bacterium]
MMVRDRPATMLGMALCLFLLAGCVVHSVKPFYTPDLLVDLPAVWHSEQNAYLFTASSAEWVAFLKKYGKNPQAFPEKDALVFTRQEKSSL